MYQSLDSMINLDQANQYEQQTMETPDTPNSGLVEAFSGDRPAEAALVNNLESALGAARPRLLRFARQHGITADAAEDVVQETFIEAWRHLNHLRTPDRFDGWLTGICRNICLRWQHSQNKTTHRLTDLSNLLVDDNNTCVGNPCSVDIPDPLALDPAEELSRQDLATLLDRALDHLPAGSREAIELYYLAELPQREAALHLGLTINALEVRLHRARRQLRQVLNNELRADAEDFGLLLDEDAPTGWRETRIWCMFCARYHMQGLLETRPDGRVNLCLRCPGCDREWIRSGGMHELSGLKSFRRAFNRMQQTVTIHWTSERNRQRCSWCGAPVQVRLLKPGEVFPSIPPWRGLKWAMYCPACDSNASTYVGSSIWLHPLAQQFMAHHPRWINEPEVLTEYASQPAFRVRLTDITSAAHLTFLLHRETLEILSTFQE